MSWYDSRPIFSRLPEKGYRDNEVVDALTSWVDEKLTAKADQLQNFYRNLDPVNAPEKYLDYLAWCVGLSGKYWDTNWSTPIKRQLITVSHTFLWRNRGTLKVISFLLKLHKIDHTIWQKGDLVMPFQMPSQFGKSQLRFTIKLPRKYTRDSPQWREAQRILDNFAPAIVDVRLSYDQFYLGKSKLGEQMWKALPKPRPILTSKDKLLTANGKYLTINGS